MRTLAELQETARRQQQQIEAQSRQIAAKEERLRQLRQQAQQQADDRRKLAEHRQAVEDREQRLQQLRALRGQALSVKATNTSLLTDLESLRNVYIEKEKELASAVFKVDELKKDLARIQKENVARQTDLNATSNVQLKQIEQELEAQNRLNELQRSRVKAQRQLLQQKKDELVSMTARAALLEGRMQGKVVDTNSPHLADANGSPPVPHRMNTIVTNEVSVEAKSPKTSINMPNSTSAVAVVTVLPDVPVTSAIVSSQHEASMVFDDFDSPDVEPSEQTKQLMGSFLPKPYGSTPATAALFSRSTGVETNPTWSVLGPNVAQQSLVSAKVAEDSKFNTFAPTLSSTIVSRSGVNSTAVAKEEMAKQSMGRSLMPASGSNKGLLLVGKQPETKLQATVTEPSLPEFNYNQAASMTSTVASRSESQSGHQRSHSSPVTSARSKSLLNIIRSSPDSQLSAKQSPPSKHHAVASVAPPQPIASDVSSSSSRVSNAPVDSSKLSYKKDEEQIVEENSVPTILAHLKPNVSQQSTSAVQQSNSSSSRPVVTRGLSPARQSPSASVVPMVDNSSKMPINTITVAAEVNAIPGELKSKYGDLQHFTTNAGSVKLYDAERLHPRSTTASIPTSQALLPPLQYTQDQPISNQQVAAKQPKASLRYASKSEIANMYVKKALPPSFSQHGSLTATNTVPYSGAIVQQLNPGSDMRQHSVLSQPSTGATNVRHKTTDSWSSNNSKDADMDDPTYPVISPALAAAVDGAMKYRRHSHSESAYPPGAFVPPGFEGEKFSFRPYAPRSMRRRSFSSEEDSLSTENRSQPARAPGSFSSDSTHGDDIIQAGGFLGQDMKNEFLAAELREGEPDKVPQVPVTVEEFSFSDMPQKIAKPGILKRQENGGRRRVTFDPLALLLDAALEGELDLLKKAINQVSDPSRPNDEGITALHNAICAGHLEIIHYLVEYGCNVNAPDTDGWTPLHCAASCNNLDILKLLVENGAAVFATTTSDQETASQKCEEEEEGYENCLHYLRDVEAALGTTNDGQVYMLYDYLAERADELSFKQGDMVKIRRRGDEYERDWWWARKGDFEGYVARNLLGLFPRRRGPATATDAN